MLRPDDSALKRAHSKISTLEKVAASYAYPGFIGLDLVTSLDNKCPDLADSKISGYV